MGKALLLQNGKMSFDQKIQIWAAIGNWVAGIGTLVAVAVSLWLVMRVEKVRVKAVVGFRELVFGDGTPFQKHLLIQVTNIGERPIVVTTIGWRIGKGKNLKYAVQIVSGAYTHDLPMELQHGKTGRFMVSLQETRDWDQRFAEGFVIDLSEKNLKTLVAQIFTSVGQTIEVVPEQGLIDHLKSFRK